MRPGAAEGRVGMVGMVGMVGWRGGDDRGLTLDIPQSGVSGWGNRRRQEISKKKKNRNTKCLLT